MPKEYAKNAILGAYRKYTQQGGSYVSGRAYCGIGYDSKRQFVSRARIRFDLTEFDEMTEAGKVTSIESVRVMIQVDSTNGAGEYVKTFRVRTYVELEDASISMPEYSENMWNALDGYYREHVCTASAGEVFTGMILQISDPKEAQYVAKNGVVIVDDETEELSQFESAAIVITYISPISAPVLTADKDKMNGGAFVGETYVHQPGASFRVSWNYSQEANNAMKSGKVSFLQEGKVLAEFEQSTPEDVVISADLWGELPTEGVIRLYARTEEKGGEYGAATQDIPFRVAYRETVSTSHMPEGSIDSDTDIALAWNNDKIASGDTVCSNPVFWKVWVTAGDSSQGVLIREPKVTVTHEILSGLESILVRIETYYTEDGVVGTYGDNGYTMRLWVRQVAEAGSVSVVTDDYGTVPPLPVVTWESTLQTAFRVKFGEFESGAIFGDATSYAVPMVFQDGTYPVQVSVQDKNGSWRAWTSPIYAVVRNRETDAVCETEIRIQCGRVLLDITGEGDAVWYAIYRDGKLIGQVNYSGMVQFSDPWINGYAVYEVLAVTSDGYYATTGEMPITLVLSDDVLTVSGRDIALRYTEKVPTEYNYKSSEDIKTMHFSKRKYPVAFHTGHFTRSISLAYGDPTGELARVMEEIEGAEVFFRDVEGGSIYGVLNKLNVRRSALGCAVSFEITETDRGDEIQFRREGV